MKVGREESIVHNKEDVHLLAYLCYLLDIAHLQSGVCGGLCPDNLSVRLDVLSYFLCVCEVNHCDVHLLSIGQDFSQVSLSAAINIIDAQYMV